MVLHCVSRGACAIPAQGFVNARDDRGPVTPGTGGNGLICELVYPRQMATAVRF